MAGIRLLQVRINPPVSLLSAVLPHEKGFVRTLYGWYSSFRSKEVSHAQFCQAPG